MECQRFADVVVLTVQTAHSRLGNGQRWLSRLAWLYSCGVIHDRVRVVNETAYRGSEGDVAPPSAVFYV